MPDILMYVCKCGETFPIEIGDDSTPENYFVDVKELPIRSVLALLSQADTSQIQCPKCNAYILASFEWSCSLYRVGEDEDLSVYCSECGQAAPGDHLGCEHNDVPTKYVDKECGGRFCEPGWYCPKCDMDDVFQGQIADGKHTVCGTEVRFLGNE